MLRILKRCYELVSDAVSALVRLIRGKSTSDDENEVDAVLAKVVPLVEEIRKNYPLGKLKSDIEHLNALLQDFSGISVDMAALLSILIQEAERFENMRGPQKKQFVITAFMRLYEIYKIDLPGIPKPLEKLFLEIFLPVVIDYIISFFNINFGQDWVRVQLPAESIRLKTGMQSFRPVGR